MRRTASTARPPTCWGRDGRRGRAAPGRSTGRCRQSGSYSYSYSYSYNPHGIGAAIARALAEQGARISLHGFRQDVGAAGDRQEPGLDFYHAQQARSAEEVAATLRESGAVAESWDADLADPDRVAELFRRAEAAFGRVDVMVNNAADCAWGVPREVSYRASKYALESYTRAAAAKLGPHGITVNAVAPGPVQSGYIASDMQEALVPEIPLRRIGQPRDIADAVVFLASEQAGWITGQLLTVHGGHGMG